MRGKPVKRSRRVRLAGVCAAEETAKAERLAHDNQKLDEEFGIRRPQM